MILAALSEAQAQTTGARLHAACRVIVISARTIERRKARRLETTDAVGHGADHAMR